MTRTLTAALALAAAMALPVQVQADESDIQAIHDSCLTDLTMPAGACDCLADIAARDLNDNEQAMVSAMVTRDDARSATLRGQMTLVEITNAAGFMTSAPSQCAAQ